MNSKLITYTATGCVVSFAWEHIARLNGVVYKPSWLLGHIAKLFNNIFNGIGKGLGMMSSYFWYLRLGELKETICCLFIPIWNILTSPFSIGIGWLNYVKTFLGENFSTDSWQFYLGLVGLLVIATGLFWKFYLKKRMNLSKNDTKNCKKNPEYSSCNTETVIPKELVSEYSPCNTEVITSEEPVGNQ